MNRKLQEIMATAKALDWRALMLALMLCSTPLTAETPALQTQINDAINLYVEETRDGGFEQVTVDIQPIDTRLRLSYCDSALELAHRPRNRSTGRLTFKVSCESPDSWAIHVPVTIQAYDNIVVSDLPIAKGTHLSASDLRLELRDVSTLYGGYFKTIAELNGFVARRPIPAEQVINAALVDPARMINRGEKVVIIGEGPGLSIRATGFAMEDGAFGELIRVKNTSSDKVVEGRITAPGQIKVSL